jgi:hypothetical protein
MEQLLQAAWFFPPSAAPARSAPRALAACPVWGAGAGLLRCADSGPAEAPARLQGQIAMASSSKATITRRVTGSSVANS